AGQAPALAGDRRGQLELEAVAMLAPVEPAAAATALVAQRHPSGQGPFVVGGQRCLARNLPLHGRGLRSWRQRLARADAGARGEGKRRQDSSGGTQATAHAPVSCSARLSARLSGSSLRLSSK